MSLHILQENLEAEGFRFRYFETGREAAEYLNRELDGKTIGMGGSMTLKNLCLYGRLSTHNQVFWHWEEPGDDTMRRAAQAQIYLTGVNAIAETGELINIDGTGNRISAASSAKEKVYFIAGVNKIAADFESAMWRARNIAAPRNARRLGRQTPCALKDEMKCYDCKSPERICRGLSVLWRPLNGVKETEVILIGENLGY